MGETNDGLCINKLVLQNEIGMMPNKPDKLTMVLATLDSYSQRALAVHMHTIIKALSAKVGSKIQLKTSDKLRAIRWIAWAQRHDVPLSFIVDVVFEWGTGVSKSVRKFKRWVSLLPISIGAMTGEACYLYVKERLSDFDGARPSEILKDRMLRERLVMPVGPAPGKMLDYASVEAWSDTYAEHIRLRRGAKDRAINALAKSKPFPGNPWR